MAGRADRGLKPLRDSEPAGVLSNGDGPHTEPSDASEEKEVGPPFWLCCTTNCVKGVLLKAFQHKAPMNACLPSSTGGGDENTSSLTLQMLHSSSFSDNAALFWQAVGGSVPALQSVHLGAAQMQDLMPSKPAAKRSFKAKADARPAVVLPPDDDEPFVPPAALLKR